MSTSYEAFLPEVLPYVHDCPEFVAVNAIRNACIEFCDRSHYWLYTHDPITAVSGVSEYELDLPDETMLARIFDGWYDRLPLKAASEEHLAKVYPMDWRTQVGRPQYVTHREPGTIIVAPVPQTTAASGISIIVALRPTRASTTVDDSIYERWAEQIGWGARARLYETVNQPYYDPQAAQAFRVRFHTACSQAQLERNRGLTRAPQVVRPPRFV